MITIVKPHVAPRLDERAMVSSRMPPSRSPVDPSASSLPGLLRALRTASPQRGRPGRPKPVLVRSNRVLTLRSILPCRTAGSPPGWRRSLRVEGNACAFQSHRRARWGSPPIVSLWRGHWAPLRSVPQVPCPDGLAALHPPAIPARSPPSCWPTEPRLGLDLRDCCFHSSHYRQGS
jgi:hypothetical protein